MNWSYRDTVLALCTLAFFATVTARLVISPVVPDVVDAFGVSTGVVGLALSGMWAAYALSQFPSGLLGDRFGERRIIVTAIGGTAVASALLALSPSYVTFLLFAITLGAAAGLHYSVATTLLTRLFDRTGRAIGVHVSGAPLAGFAAPVLAAVAGNRYGWRAAVAVGAAVAIPIVAVFFTQIRPTEPRRPEQPIRDQVDADRLAGVLTRPTVAYTTALCAMGAFTWQATASFLPAFLELGYGLSRTTAGLLFSLYFLVNGGVQPVVGALSDRYSRDAAAAVTMTAGLVGFAVLIAGDGLATAVAGVACVGVAMTWGAPLQSRVVDVLSTAERGLGFGLVRTAYMILGATGSVAVGTAADAFGWTVAFGTLSAIMALGLSAILVNNALSLGY
ncbi:MFS transporter [Natrinema salifodinae]|uniref:Predicted arabinose efflux permease, MFS family n=1 Tax=Natrinema salifodinae TaxID=1202768 RepID=A0A1I0PH61_9EURY|nr:MFS transporter [Natrinema salifodinae]SEW13612.1 Predicted arabinose efflux permease, MFS family [Natrinema salifodinae]